jgi:predicted phage baseplate assembly protein
MDGHWLRCRVATDGYEIPPQFDRIRTNVVEARHAVTVADEQLRLREDGKSHHRSPLLDGQSYTFAKSPVLSATVSVDGEEFTEVSDFDASGAEDPHYVLDRERGTVTFGDGVAGRVPPPGATVTASYVYGGGDEGNVSGAATWRFTDSGPGADLPVAEIDIEAGPASGGTEAESIQEALRRARRDLRRPYRAVTDEDYQYLAANTPGLRIGRTNVWIDGEETTVVVVPYAPPSVHSPRPSAAFLDTVRDHLRERTLLTDSVTVSGPRYVRLELSISGGIRSQYAKSGYESAITGAIESYLHPLTGFDGDGWPFGRSLTETELIAEIETVDAVDYVSGLRITAHGGTTLDDGRVRIDETALFSVEDVTVDMTATEGR